MKYYTRRLVALIVMVCTVLCSAYSLTIIKYQDSRTNEWWNRSLREEKKEAVQEYTQDDSVKVYEHNGMTHIEIKTFDDNQKRAKIQTDNKEVVEWLTRKK